MRNLNINLPVGYDLPFETQIKIVRDAGWDGVFIGTRHGQDLRLKAEQIRNAGLNFEAIHAPFTNSYQLWEEEEAGKLEAEALINHIRMASALEVPKVVMHAIIGMQRHTPTELGLTRFDQILSAGEKYGVTVAVENTEGEEYLEAIFKAFGDRSSLGFCIDTGHEMCYNDRRDLITRYGRWLTCTHINDNFGRTGEQHTWMDDLHLLPFDGSADFQDVADRMNAVGYTGDLTFELTRRSKPGMHTHDIYEGLDFAGFISLALERAKRFARLVEGNE